MNGKFKNNESQKMKKHIAILSALILATLNLHAYTYPTSVTVDEFAQNESPATFSTYSSSTGISTFWTIYVTISKTGVITGSGTMETFSKEGKSLGITNVSVKSGSITPKTLIRGATKNTIIDDLGSIMHGKRVYSATYPASLIATTSNGYTIYGKALYHLRETENGDWDDNMVLFNLQIKGPNGQFGMIPK